MPRASVPCGGSSPPSPATLPIFWSIFLPIFSSHFLPNIFLPLPFSSSATIHPIFFSCSNFSYLPPLLLDIHSAYFYHVVRHFCNLICCCVFSSQLTCFLPSVKQKECLECLALSSRTVIAWDKKVELVLYLIY